MKIKEFVSARAVHDIREAYDTYELAIYGEKHTTLTKHGNHRGIPSSMPPLDVAMKRLNGMSRDAQGRVKYGALSCSCSFARSTSITSFT